MTVRLQYLYLTTFSGVRNGVSHQGLAMGSMGRRSRFPITVFEKDEAKVGLMKVPAFLAEESHTFLKHVV